MIEDDVLEINIGEIGTTVSLIQSLEYTSLNGYIYVLEALNRSLS